MPLQMHQASEDAKCVREDGGVEQKLCSLLTVHRPGRLRITPPGLAKEGKSRFGLETMVADWRLRLRNLDTLPEDKIAMFVLATYGAGDLPITLLTSTSLSLAGVAFSEP